ncbi:hypothetical protein RCL1_004291 [Eukaryota sp. TZLM3-RCL]
MNPLDVQCLSWLLQNPLDVVPGENDHHIAVPFDQVSLYTTHPALADVLEKDPHEAKSVVLRNIKRIYSTLSDISLIPKCITSCFDNVHLLQWKSCFIIVHGFITYLPKSPSAVIYSVQSTHIATSHAPDPSIIPLHVKSSIIIPPEGTYLCVCGVLGTDSVKTYDFPHLVPSITVHAVLKPMAFPPVAPYSQLDQLSPFYILQNLFKSSAKVVFALLLSVVSCYFPLDRPQKLHVSFRRNDYKYAQQLVKLAPFSSFPLNSDFIPAIKNSVVMCPTLSNLKVQKLVTCGACIWAVGGEITDPFDFFCNFWEEPAVVKDLNQFNSFSDISQHFAPVSDEVFSFLKRWVLSAVAMRSQLTSHAQQRLMDCFEDLRQNSITIPAAESIAIAAACHASLRGLVEVQVADVDAVMSLFSVGGDES